MAKLEMEIDAIIETLAVVKLAQRDPATKDRLMALAFRALQTQGDLSALVARSLSRHLRAKPQADDAQAHSEAQTSSFGH